MSGSVTQVVTGSRLTRARNISFSASLDLDVTSGHPVTQLAISLAID